MGWNQGKRTFPPGCRSLITFLFGTTRKFRKAWADNVSAITEDAQGGSGWELKALLARWDEQTGNFHHCRHDFEGKTKSEEDYADVIYEDSRVCYG